MRKASKTTERLNSLTTSIANVAGKVVAQGDKIDAHIKQTQHDIAKVMQLANPPKLVGEGSNDVDNQLLGEYIVQQHASGVTMIDMKRLDDVRAGIRLTLNWFDTLPTGIEYPTKG